MDMKNILNKLSQLNESTSKRKLSESHIEGVAEGSADLKRRIKELEKKARYYSGEEPQADPKTGHSYRPNYIETVKEIERLKQKLKQGVAEGRAAWETEEESAAIQELLDLFKEAAIEGDEEKMERLRIEISDATEKARLAARERGYEHGGPPAGWKLDEQDVMEGIMDEPSTTDTPTGRVHKAKPGGYGRRDDTDDEGKKVAPTVKRGRGRPRKDADSATGEVNKPDWSAFGVTKKDVKLPKWDKSKTTKHSLKEWVQEIENKYVAEAELTVQPIPTTPEQKQAASTASKQTFLIKDPSNPQAFAITTSDPAVVNAAKKGTLTMQKPGSSPTQGAAPATGAGSQVAPMSGVQMKEEGGKKWIQKAVKHPGAFTKKAKSHGMSTGAFAKKVLANKKDYPAKTEKQAVLAKTLKGLGEGEHTQHAFVNGKPNTPTAGSVGKPETKWKRDPITAATNAIYDKITRSKVKEADIPSDQQDEGAGLGRGRSMTTLESKKSEIKFKKEYRTFLESQGIKVTNQMLEEGWKSKLASLGMAGAMALGAGGAHAGGARSDDIGNTAANQNSPVQKMQQQSNSTGAFKRALAYGRVNQEFNRDLFDGLSALSKELGHNPTWKEADEFAALLLRINGVDKPLKEAKKPDANKNGIPDYAEDGKGKNDLKKKKKVKEGMNENLLAARLKGKHDGLKGHSHCGKTYEDMEEARCYHEGYKEGLDECYGQMPIQGLSVVDEVSDMAVVDDMASFGAHHDEVDEAVRAWDKSARDSGEDPFPLTQPARDALAKNVWRNRKAHRYQSQIDPAGRERNTGSDAAKDSGANQRWVASGGAAGGDRGDRVSYNSPYPRRPANFKYETDLDEVSRREYMKKKAKETPGDTFNAFGQTMHDKDVLEMDSVFESWNNQLSSLLEEHQDIQEGMTVSISKGQQGTPDSVSVSAQDGEAEQLLSIIKQAGLGLFGGEEPVQHGSSSPMSVSADNSPDDVDAEIEVVDDHDGMMSLIKKMTGDNMHGDHEDHEDSCNECGMLESSCECEKEPVDEVQSGNQRMYQVAEDNPPDSGAEENEEEVQSDASEEESSSDEGGADNESEEEQVDESYANSEDDGYEADINFMLKSISGGLNKEKSTGQTTIPVIAGQDDRMGAARLGNPMKESTDLLTDWKKLSGIK